MRRRGVVVRGIALSPGKIRELRIGQGRTQADLADAADVSVDTVGRAENGTTVSLESATAIAAILGVDLSTLTAGPAANGRPTPPPAESNIPEGMVPRHFIGREQALADIAGALEGGRGRVAITALHGLRGVGKTVLAAAYAEQHRADHRATWWIRAETESGLRADLVGLGVALGWVAPDEKEEPALAVVKERLQQGGDRILLIFDNARDVEALRPWLPHGGASRVIVTSNAPAWGAIATPVAIQVWPKETGADFLILRTGRQSERAATEALSEALGGLPLAHEMAASYCERTGMSFAEYRRRFDSAPARLLDSDKDAPAEYHERLTVAKTFALAIDEAAKLHPAAEPLITLSALLAPEAIPLFLFAEGHEKFEPLAKLFPEGGLDEAVAALRAFALVECETIEDERDSSITTDTFRLHPLVREVAAQRMERGDREAARRALVGAMAAVYPHDVSENPTSWPRARRLDGLALELVGGDAPLPSEGDRPTSYVLSQIASYRQSALAAYSEARVLFERALAIDENVLGPEHPDTAANLNNLAGLIHEQGDLQAAQPLYERALAIREKTLGNEHPDTAQSLDKLASLLRALGDFDRARRVLERALAIYEKTLGPGHPATAIVLNNLALLLCHQGNFVGARPLVERALAISQTTLGPEHPATATGLSNLAILTEALGDLSSARVLFERALAICEKVLGPEHPRTATSLSNLAALLGAEGDLAGSRALLERALAIYENVLGPQHPDTAAARQKITTLMNRPA